MAGPGTLLPFSRRPRFVSFGRHFCRAVTSQTGRSFVNRARLFVNAMPQTEATSLYSKADAERMQPYCLHSVTSTNEGGRTVASPKIQGKAYRPQDLLTISRAFDEAWARVAQSFVGHEGRIDSARSKLADEVLSVATRGVSKPDHLKTIALVNFCMNGKSAALCQRSM
jgi:hypothetical protein